ncbi:hypothetical protein D3C72_2021350 [compost metagenome]
MFRAPFPRLSSIAPPGAWGFVAPAPLAPLRSAAIEPAQTNSEAAMVAVSPAAP